MAKDLRRFVRVNIFLECRHSVLYSWNIPKLNSPSFIQPSVFPITLNNYYYYLWLLLIQWLTRSRRKRQRCRGACALHFRAQVPISTILNRISFTKKKKRKFIIFETIDLTEYLCDSLLKEMTIESEGKNILPME